MCVLWIVASGMMQFPIPIWRMANRGEEEKMRKSFEAGSPPPQGGWRCIPLTLSCQGLVLWFGLSDLDLQGFRTGSEDMGLWGMQRVDCNVCTVQVLRRTQVVCECACVCGCVSPILHEARGPRTICFDMAIFVCRFVHSL
ncbi:unnamed protein product [Ostreobium quekettii]|uniref:Uncharacterized protein n=1 Tax=Ostreobium quekettii TaxID=121088 RepID=A0A8S1J8E8_9CHLO|nr:unnamed protein product [Ostreobium quekettii]